MENLSLGAFYYPFEISYYRVIIFNISSIDFTTNVAYLRIFMSLIPSALSFLMLWFKPPGFTENEYLIWFTVWHTAVYTFLTVK